MLSNIGVDFQQRLITRKVFNYLYIYMYLLLERHMLHILSSLPDDLWVGTNSARFQFQTIDFLSF